MDIEDEGEESPTRQKDFEDIMNLSDDEAFSLKPKKRGISTFGLRQSPSRAKKSQVGMRSTSKAPGHGIMRAIGSPNADLLIDC